MAAVNYLYRSKKERAFLNLRLLFTHNHTDSVYGGKTKLEVTRLYWDKYHTHHTLGYQSYHTSAYHTSGYLAFHTLGYHAYIWDIIRISLWAYY